jgi:hypothetical protein
MTNLNTGMHRSLNMDGRVRTEFRFKVYQCVTDNLWIATVIDVFSRRDALVRLTFTRSFVVSSTIPNLPSNVLRFLIGHLPGPRRAFSTVYTSVHRHRNGSPTAMHGSMTMPSTAYHHSFTTVV